MKYGDTFNPFGHFQGMFIPNCIAQSYLKDSSKLLIGRLFQYAGQNGKAFPFRESLAIELNWELRKLDRNIRELKNEGLLKTIQDKEDGPSTYIFLYHSIYEPTVKNDSTPSVKNDKHKNKYINNKKDKRLSKDNHCDSDESQKKRKKKSDQSCLSKKRILRKIKRKTPKIVKKEKVKPAPKSKYVHSLLDLRNYNELKSCGITNHRAGTKSELDSIDSLHALFKVGCKNPYHNIYVPDEFKDHEWSLDDLIEIFNYQIEYASSPVKAIGKFIFSQGYSHKDGKSVPDNAKSWSPLLFWAQKMMKTDDSLNDEGTKLYKIMVKREIRDCQDLESKIINKVSEKLKEAESKYEFVDSTSSNITYPAGIFSAFVIYIKERLNKLSFELVYITKKDFVDEFLKVATKRNILKKKNGRRGVN